MCDTQTMPTERSKLLVATGNKGKLSELKGLLAELPIELLSLDDIGSFDEIEETGATFAENAALKARGYARLAGIPTLADDSGLEVETLDNRPGVFSARYGGVDLGFDQKMSMLLLQLSRPNVLFNSLIGAQLVLNVVLIINHQLLFQVVI